MCRGERLPTASEQWTLAKSHRRTQLKDRNALYRQMWEYESEDDMGENMGDAVDQADLDEEAAGQLEDGAAAEGGEKKAAPKKEKDEWSSPI